MEIDELKNKKIENWFKGILERTGADTVEVREVLAAFSGLPFNVVQVIILIGINCLSFFEKSQIGFLMALMEDTRESLLAERNEKSYFKIFEAQVGYLLTHLEEDSDVIKEIKRGLLSFPAHDNKRTACLFFFLEKCLQFSLHSLDGFFEEAIDEAVDIGASLL